MFLSTHGMVPCYLYLARTCFSGQATAGVSVNNRKRITMSRYLSGSLIAAACLIQLSAAPTPAAAESSVTPVQADSFSRDELVCALNPQCGGERAMIRHRGLVPDNPGTEPGRSAPPFFNSITFDFNSSNLTPQARATLDRIGDALRDPTISDVKLKVEGHTDAKGTVPYNQTL